MSRLGLVDGGEHRIDLVDRLLGIAANVEVDDRGVAIGRDLIGVRPLERCGRW